MLQITQIRGEPLFLGHSNKLTWKNPIDPNFKETVVIRYHGHFSLDPASPFGLEIYRGTATEIYDYHRENSAVLRFSDLPDYDSLPDPEKEKWLEGEQTYYYTFYAVDKENQYHATALSTCAVTTTKRYYIGQWLYNLLPEVYRKYDEQTLALKRFFDIIGIELDFIYSLINVSQGKYNTLQANPDLLSFIAKTLDWDMDSTLPINIQRMVLANAVRLYKYIGTKKGISSVVRYYSGFPETSYIYETYQNILKTLYFGVTDDDPVTNIESKTPNFDDFDKDSLYFTWDFRPDATISSDTFFIEIAPTYPISEEEKQLIITRVSRIVDTFKPINSRYEINVL